MGQDAARLGQLFMLGFCGTALSADHWLVGAVRDQGLGGVILFDRNVDGTVQNVVSPDQLRRLVDDLQQLAPLPLLVGIDQEGNGGRGVSHTRTVAVSVSSVPARPSQVRAAAVGLDAEVAERVDPPVELGLPARCPGYRGAIGTFLAWPP